MNQLTFSDIEYSNRKKTTKHEEFLNTMEALGGNDSPILFP